MTKEEMVKEVKRNLTGEEIIRLWNGYCDNQPSHNKNKIYDNDEESLSSIFGSISEALRAAERGSYSTTDEYFWYESNHLYSFNYVDDCYSPVDFKKLAEWKMSI